MRIISYSNSKQIEINLRKYYKKRKKFINYGNKIKKLVFQLKEGDKVFFTHKIPENQKKE